MLNRYPQSTQLNLQISVYWLWLVIVFGAVAITPWHPHSGRSAGHVTYLPVVTAYSINGLDDSQPTLIGHALVTFCLAVFAATAHSVILAAKGRSESATFSLRMLLVATGVLAAIFGVLRWCKAPPIVYGVVILFFVGNYVTKIVAGLISRRMATHK